MSSALNDPAFFHHEYLIAMHKPVRDEYRGNSFAAEAFYRPMYLVFGHGVKVARRFVENENLGTSQ